MNGMRGLDGRTLLRRRQHGLATVEFAIALPLLLLLLLAIGEFGRMLAHYNTLLQSSRDAARYAAQNALNNTTNRMNLSDSLKATSRNLAAYGHPAVQATALLPGLTPASVQVPESEPEIVQPDLFGDEPIAPPPRRGQAASRARALYDAPAVEPVRAVPADTTVAVNDIEQVIALHVVAREHLFRGEDLLRCLLSYGLRYGDMSIFHRHEQPTGQVRVLFSMAKAVEPGTFDLEAMTAEDVPGVSFFLGLPGVNSISAWELMVDTARRLAHELQGEVLD